MDYFVSDLHFHHSNIVNFERMQFNSIEEHDTYIVKLLVNKLRKDDTLYVLGDFGNLEGELKEMFIKLPCKKILVLGNHDKFKPGFYETEYHFTQVHTTPVFYKNRILLSHFPMMVNDGIVNVHGHLHNAKLVLPNYINCNIHILDYTLMDEKKLHRKLCSIPKDSSKFLEEWYAPYYQYTRKMDDIITDADGNIDVLETKKLRDK